MAAGDDKKKLCPICIFKGIQAKDPEAALFSAMAFSEVCVTMTGNPHFGPTLAQLGCSEHGEAYILAAIQRTIGHQQPLEEELTKRGVPTDINTVKAAIQAAMKSGGSKKDERPN